MANRVIDADGHICEPPAVWNDYIEKRYRANAIRVERDGDGRDWISINGTLRRNLRPAAACVPWGMDDPDKVPSWEDILPGSYDGGARATVLEEEGIERSLLFPSLYLLAGDIDDPAVAAAACHGYNEWIADMCRDGRGKLAAVGIVPLQNVEAAAREAQHIARLGLKGVCFRPERYKGLALYDDSLQPFWQAVSDNGLFAAVHGSFGSLMPSFATSRYDNLFFSHMICHPFEQMAACLDILAGGVLDRHPNLRVAFLESGLGWLEYWLDRLDGHFEFDAPSRAVAEAAADRAVPRTLLHLDRVGRGPPPAAPARDEARALRLLGRRLSPLRLHLSRRGDRAGGAPGAAAAVAGRRRALADGGAFPRVETYGRLSRRPRSACSFPCRPAGRPARRATPSNPRPARPGPRSGAARRRR